MSANTDFVENAGISFIIFSVAVMQESDHLVLQSETIPRKMVPVRPSEDARYDMLAHWQVKLDKRRRCKVCKMKTDANCKKFSVPICFNKSRDSFREYHTK